MAVPARAEIVTVAEFTKVPAAGEKVGAGTCDSITYVAVLAVLTELPDAAIALIVWVDVTVIGPVNCADDVVGVLPSVV